MKPSTIPPTRLGMKKPARKMFCPFTPVVRAYARRNASRLVSTTVKATYRSVSPKELQKWESAKTEA
ncbi:hypothetical protein D3C81_1960300 [compost metagenome]